MKKFEYENDVVKIYTDEEDHYLFIEYQMPAIHIEIVDIWANAAFMIATKKLTSYILDARKLGGLSEESNKFINEIVLPKLAGLGVKKAAVIIPESAFEKILSESMIEKIETGKFIVHQVFTSFDNALAWIKQPPTTNN